MKRPDLNQEPNLRPPRVVRFTEEWDPRAMNGRMFQEDIHLHVMPVRGCSQARPDFRAEVRADEKDSVGALQLLSSVSDYRRDNDQEAISDAIRRIAHYLTVEGRVLYEIIRDESGDACELYSFSSRRVFRIANHYFQWVSKRDRQWSGVKTKGFVSLPERDVWDISIPRKLGGSRGYYSTLRRLDRYSPMGPDFVRKEIEDGHFPKDFNFADYTRQEQILAFRATQQWGWTARDASLKYNTEYFFFYRTLIFAWAEAVLREHIVSEINKLLKREKIQAEIRIAGIPTPNEILSLKQQLDEHKIEFEEINKGLAIN